MDETTVKELLDEFEKLQEEKFEIKREALRTRFDFYFEQLAAMDEKTVLPVSNVIGMIYELRKRLD